jgi:hypothetical protein
VWEGVDLVQRQVTEDELYQAGWKFDWVFHSFAIPVHANKRHLSRIPCVVGQPYNANGPRILYNGSLQDDWIRLTDAFGRRTLEFPVFTTEEVWRAGAWQGLFVGPARRVELRDLAPDVKPVLPKEYLAHNVVPIGRFSCFDRKILSHDAYGRVRGVLNV